MVHLVFYSMFETHFIEFLLQHPQWDSGIFVNSSTILNSADEFDGNDNLYELRYKSNSLAHLSSSSRHARMLKFAAMNTD